MLRGTLPPLCVAAMPDAYGWRRDLGDEAILERLVALNLAREAA